MTRISAACFGTPTDLTESYHEREDAAGCSAISWSLSNHNKRLYSRHVTASCSHSNSMSVLQFVGTL